MNTCIKCDRKLDFMTTAKTLDKATVCTACYSEIAGVLKKGVFTEKEVEKAIKIEKDMLKKRNKMFLVMLQATLLNGKDASFMVDTVKGEVKSRCKKYYNHLPKLLSTNEKNFLVEDIYKDYKVLFGDFSEEECAKQVIRQHKKGYYAFLTLFNIDLAY